MGRIGHLTEASPQAKPPPGGGGFLSPTLASAEIVDGDRVAHMRQRPCRLRALLPELQRAIVARERAERLDLAVDDLAEAGVAELAADHPELPRRVRHRRYSAASLMGCVGSSPAPNCAASVEPFIAVVLDWPPEIAKATASK